MFGLRLACGAGFSPRKRGVGQCQSYVIRVGVWQGLYGENIDENQDYGREFPSFRPRHDIGYPVHVIRGSDGNVSRGRPFGQKSPAREPACFLGQSLIYLMRRTKFQRKLPVSRPRHAIQQLHEDYWSERWAEALGRDLMNGQVRVCQPESDKPDAVFCLSKRDGTEARTWGEVTCIYYDNQEAEYLWGGQPRSRPTPAFSGSDKTIADKAAKAVRVKYNKFKTWAQQYGIGHLLVVLMHRLTTRSTRVETENSIHDLLRSPGLTDSGTFQSVWLAYHLPEMVPSEREALEYVFPDPTSGGRRNFFKCIWPPSGF